MKQSVVKNEENETVIFQLLGHIIKNTCIMLSTLGRLCKVFGGAVYILMYLYDIFIQQKYGVCD